MSFNQRISSIIQRKLMQEQSILNIMSQQNQQKPISQCVDKLFKLIVKIKQTKSKKQKQFPVRIRENIFVGSYVYTGDVSFLQQNNIGLVISCMDVAPLKILPNIRYQKVSIKDKQGQSLLIHAQKIRSLIQNHLTTTNNNNTTQNIFIHCFQGKSRSVSLLMMFLMEKQRRTFNELYNQIKAIYPIARINGWFVKQLREYQKQLGLMVVDDGNNNDDGSNYVLVDGNNNDDGSNYVDDININDNDNLLSFNHHHQSIVDNNNNNHDSDLLGFQQQHQQSTISINDPRQHLLIPQQQKITQQQQKQQYHLIQIEQDQDINTNNSNVQNVQLI